MPQDPPPPPRNILPDCIIPGLALAFTIYYLTTITEVPWTSQASAVVVSGLLTLSILAFVVRSAWRLRRGVEVVRVDGALRGLLGEGTTRARRLLLLALTVGYVWIIQYVGFTLTTLAFLSCAIVLLSSLANWRRALVIALSSSLVGYVVFVYFFRTRFPTGPIEEWLKGVL